MVTYEVHVVNLPEQPAVVIRGHVDHDGIAAFLSEAFGEIMALLQRQHADHRRVVRSLPGGCRRRLGLS